MDFARTEDQRAIVENVAGIVARFDEAYWLERDQTGTYPKEFYTAMAKAGWLGIAMPESVGGAGLGIVETALVMMTVTDSPGAMAAASAIHLNIFGPHAICVAGTEQQKQNLLPPIIAGEITCCFGVTEPDAGLDTGNITTRAEKIDGGWRITGRKIWTSSAESADRILLLARTTPKEDCARSTDGLTLFFADMDRSKVEVRAIPKMGRAAIASNMVFIDGLEVPDERRIGEVDEGFRCLLHSLNPERILVAAEAVGIGRQALGRASDYAKERVVFNRPIGKNQAIQHPLAKCWVALEAAELLTLRAGWLYDQGAECGAAANAAKYFAAEAGFEAAETAVLTLGGMGYAQEYHVERLLREAWIPRLAPVSAQLMLCYMADKVLDQPRSY
jgi:acyl-CoA dehydrogenase